MSDHLSLFTAVYEEEPEEWRDIPGLENYQASSLGNIRTRWTVGSGNKIPRLTDTWQFVKTTNSTYGYLGFHPVWFKGTKQRYCSVHRLVCLAFHGEPPPGNWIEAAHFPDQNKHNNRADNLSWKTRQENQKDRIAHGTDIRGEKHCRAKLKDNDIREIRRLSGSMTYAKIERMFNVSGKQIKLIVTGRSWAHVKES